MIDNTISFDIIEMMVQILDPLVTDSMMLGKLLNLSKPQFLYL